MARRVLLAVLVCLSIWAAAVRAFEARGVTEAPAADVSLLTPDVPQESAPSDHSWHAAQPASVSVAVSWTPHLTLQVIDVPGIGRRQEQIVARLRHARTYPTPSRPLHLHDIPLLI